MNKKNNPFECVYSIEKKKKTIHVNIMSKRKNSKSVNNGKMHDDIYHKQYIK